MSKETNLESKAQIFKTEIRANTKGEKQPYVLMEIAKKVKLKHEGKDRTENPAFTVYIRVIESNLPLPASVYNPVFMFKRGCPFVENEHGTGIVDRGDVYVGSPSPGQYFTLPDFDNKINPDAVEAITNEKADAPDPIKWRIGEYYLTSAFIQIFASAKEADEFINKVKTELRQFLIDLDTFMKTRPEMVEWGGYEYHAVSKTFVKHTRLVSGDGSFASFTEGNVKKHG